MVVVGRAGARCAPILRIIAGPVNSSINESSYLIRKLTFSSSNISTLAEFICCLRF